MAKKATKTIEGTVVDIEFVNGEHVSGDLAKLPDEIKTRLALHGLSQKMGDSYAGTDTVEESIAAAQRVLEDLLAGNWSTQRAGGGGGVRVTLLAEALAAIASKQLGREVSVEEATEIVSEMDDDAKKALRGDDAIKAEIARIKLKRAEEAAAKSESSVADLFA